MPESKKRKKSYYILSSKKRRADQEDLKPGLKGYIITFNGDNSHRTVREAYHILNEYADIKYGPEFPEIKQDGDDDEENLEDALKKEVSDIKDANKKGAVRRFQSVTTKAKNVIFIKANIEDHEVLLQDIFADLLLTQIKKTQVCLRFFPVMTTCHAKTETIIDSVKKCVAPVFVEQETDKALEFCITFKSRCNTAVKRDDILPPLVDYIYSSTAQHVTNYRDPELVVSIDIIGGVCAIGLLKNFLKFKKYNIDMLIQMEELDVEAQGKEVSGDGECTESASNVASVTSLSDNLDTQESNENAEGEIAALVTDTKPDRTEEEKSNIDIKPKGSVQVETCSTRETPGDGEV